MKLISLNIEGKRHLTKIHSFIKSELADVVCLMEAPEDLQHWLEEQGYFTTFAPMLLREQDGQQFTEGLILASKVVHNAEAFYYYQPATAIRAFDGQNKRDTIAHAVLFASIADYNIATTHFTWNPVGETADENQATDLVTLLTHLRTKPPHVLCGDFNIPRHHNSLYEELLQHYTDTIPVTYHSSLDPKFHRASENTDLQKLFTQFMVDYVFTQDPYRASGVRLQFDLSDHAAVVATITQVHS